VTQVLARAQNRRYNRVTKIEVTGSFIVTMRDLALSVREVAPRAYGWVIMQGTGEQRMFEAYVQVEVSEQQYDSYSDALLAGFARLRALGGREGPRGIGPFN
jgi:hypothetical protein